MRFGQKFAWHISLKSKGVDRMQLYQGNLSSCTYHLFPVLKQNVCGHKLIYDCDVDAVVT